MKVKIILTISSLSFFFFFLIGSNIFSDYSVTPDEPLQNKWIYFA